MKKVAVKIMKRDLKRIVKYDFIDENIAREATRNSDSRVKLCPPAEAQAWLKENNSSDKIPDKSKITEIKKMDVKKK